jgi:hypothetical protein
MRTIPDHGRNHPRTWVLATLLAALLAAWGPRAAWSEEDGKDETGSAAKPNDAPAQPAPKREPLLPKALENPKDFKDLVEAGRSYFDLEDELWTGRKAVLEQLTLLADQGKHPLKDMEFLRWFVNQSRFFLPEMTDRKWQRANGVTEAKGLGGTMEWVKSELLTVTFSVPRKAWENKDLHSKFPRQDPYPLLLAMHEKKDDVGKKYPGQEYLDRTYPKATFEELYQDWMVLVPVAAAGVYVKDGMVRNEVFKQPYSEFWKHYHIDFERVVLDGSDDQAFTVAAAIPVFFAGIVFRGEWTLETDAQKAAVRNFAPVPVYVVDNPKLAQALKDAGHPDVTAGISGPILYKWMNERRRKTPRAFRWTAQVYDQVLPHWINIDTANWNAPERTLAVEVVDTVEDPNTVRIEAAGVDRLSLYLNDDVVDLDRPVRVVINGHLEHDAMLAPTDENTARLGRDFDALFNKEPVRIRKSMFFGWLTPARIVQLQVRPPKPKEIVVAPKDEGPKEPEATADQETEAARYMQKARVFKEQGQIEKAIEYARKVLELPRNKQTEDAKALVAELEK